MSKYDQLKHHLQSLGTNEWRASFQEIEAILGFELPASARAYPAWWANQASDVAVQKNAWMDAGWRTEELDLTRDRVVFRHRARPPSPGLRSVAPVRATEAPTGLTTACELRLKFVWSQLGPVRIDAAGRLAFPAAAPGPAVYRFRIFLGSSEARYVGEAEDLGRRLAHYRIPGRSQLTNLRINKLICEALAEGASATVEIVTEARIEGVAADLSLVAVRRLIENAALVKGGGEDITSVNF